MHFTILSVFLLTITKSLNVNGQGTAVGDLCTIRRNSQPGVCQLISKCQSALDDIQKNHIFPDTTCGFEGSQPVICCAISGGVIQTTPTTTTTRRISIPSRPPTTPSTTKMTTTTRSLIPGDRSRQKCQEYSKYALETAGIASLIDDDEDLKVDNCPITVITDISGGNKSEPKEFPHMALIGFEDANKKIHWDCGGSLISERFILTAAHCLYSDTYEEPKHILLGDLDLDSSTDDARPEQIAISRLIAHPEFKPPSTYNDIALIELSKNARLSTYVRPACLNTVPDLTNARALISGWGQVGFFEQKSTALLFALVDMFSHAQCNRTYRNNVGITLRNGIVDETQICAGSKTENKDTCPGDSGGPLQLNNNEEVHCTYRIIGVTSFGKLCGTPGIPGVYTRVSAYIKWIEDIVWP